MSSHLSLKSAKKITFPAELADGRTGQTAISNDRIAAQLKIIFKLLISYLSHRIIHSFPRILRLNNFVSPKGPKARLNKTGINFIILFKFSSEIHGITMLCMIFHYG